MILAHLTTEQLVLRTIVTCSVLHNVLPPWDWIPPGSDGREWLADFPTIKKYYRLLIYVVGYMALNARSAVYRSISTSNPTGPNSNNPQAQEAKPDAKKTD